MVRALPLILLALPAYADEELLTCRDIQDTTQRVACYDQLIDRRYAPTLSTQAPSATQPSPQAEPPQEPVVMGSDNSADNATIKDTAEIDTSIKDNSIDEFGKPARPISTRSEVSATVKALNMTAHKKLIITLDNHQIWHQLDSSRMRLKAGDNITIKSAQLGSFQLSKASGGKSIRVRRVD